MTLAVAAGNVVIKHVQAAVTAGNVTITTAHATNPRFDLVVVNNAGTKSVTAGTPAADPVFPAIPANSVVLAAVYVLANDTAIAANQITDKRVIVPLPVLSYVLPDGAVSETLPRALSFANSSIAVTSGTMRMVAVYLPVDTVITSITFVSGSTALATGTNGWFALYDRDRVLLRQSTNDTGPTFPTNTAKTYNLSSTYITTYSGVHYLGILFTGSTMPTLAGSTIAAGVQSIAPIQSGNSSTGLTTTAPDPAAALTGVGGVPYAYAS